MRRIASYIIVASLVVFISVAALSAGSFNSSYHADTTWHPYWHFGDSLIVLKSNPGGLLTGKWIKTKSIVKGTVIFNFNPSAQNVSGMIDVSGSPGASQITAVDTKTGWSITSTLFTTGSTSGWINFGGATSGLVGETINDGGGFWQDSLLVRSAWYTTMNFPGTAFLTISNLDPSQIYNINILSSNAVANGAPSDDTCGFFVTGIDTLGGATSTPYLDTAAYKFIWPKGNTSHLVTFTNVPASALGKIYIYFLSKSTSRTQYNQYNIINGLEISNQ